MRPASIAKAQDGYSRWLGFLIYTGQLDPTMEPGGRITLPRFLNYIELLHANGNRGHTIYGRVSELRSAMRCLAPNADFGWLTSPGGVPMHSILDMQSQEVETYDPAELYHWGIELMQKAITLNGPARRRVMLRDGLLIAILASRGIRLRTMTALKLHKNIFRRDDGWFCFAEPEITKNRKPLAFPLRGSLNPWIDRYVARERQELLGGKHDDAFWVNWSGDPLASDGVTKRFYWLTEKRFGRDRRFGPHRMRHCLVTSAADSGQEVYAAAPALLGHTQRVAAEHYNRSDGSAAFARFQEAIMDERRRTETLARNIFESRDPGRIGHAAEEEDWL
jgi:site-specific recombinase XerD